MTRFMTATLRFGSIAALAASLVACGEEDLQGSKLGHFSLASQTGPDGWALSDDSDSYDTLEPVPAALPMTSGDVQSYGYAPSWDYGSDSYVAYDDANAYESYDDDYIPYQGDQTEYYDQSAGSDQYAWLALAAMIAGVIGDSPPDYGFAYADTQPWAWRTGDGYTRYAEPVRGGYRYYYYEPRAKRPFLVRDPYYSYGYRDDRLVAIYDRDGRVLNARAVARQRAAARNYFARADRLYRAGHAEHHHGISARRWEARRIALAHDRRELREARERRIAWRQWETRHERVLANRWRAERQARERAADRYVEWRKASYRGPAPRFYEAERQAHERAVAKLQRERRARIAAQDRTRRADIREAREDAADARRDRRREIALREARADVRQQRRQRLAVEARAEKQAEQRKSVRSKAVRQASKQRAAQHAREERKDAQRRQALADRREAQKRKLVQAAQDKRQQARADAAKQERQKQAVQQRIAERKDAQRRQAAAERREAQKRKVAQAAQQKRQEARAEAADKRRLAAAAQQRKQEAVERAADRKRQALLKAQERKEAARQQAQAAKQREVAAKRLADARAEQQKQAAERKAARAEKAAEARRAQAQRKADKVRQARVESPKRNPNERKLASRE